MSSSYFSHGLEGPDFQKSTPENWQRADFAIPPGPGGFIIAIIMTLIVGQLFSNIGIYALSELKMALLDERPGKALVAFGLVGVVIAALLRIKLFK